MKETWKWALVVVLLAVFLLLAKQAYISLTKDQDILPPTDYMQGGSYDIEHKTGPGAGQPIELPDNTTNLNPQALQQPEAAQLPLDHVDQLDWNKEDDPKGGK